MASGCMLEDALYTTLTIATVLCLMTQFLCTLRYPWFLFGESGGKIRLKHATAEFRIHVKLWFRRKIGHFVVHDPPDIEILELKSENDFLKAIFPDVSVSDRFPKSSDDTLGQVSDNKIKLTQPLHMATSATSSRCSPCHHVSSHHFVVVDIEYLPKGEDYVLTTLEYDGNWCTKALLKTGQFVNGQVQMKRRYLEPMLSDTGSIFLLQHRLARANREEILAKFDDFHGEVSWELVMNNCEHFVNYLMFNEHVSYQKWCKTYCKQMNNYFTPQQKLQSFLTQKTIFCLKAAPFGQLPILEVDGKLLPQSKAIARFLAKKFDLVGKNDFESALCDSLVDGSEEVLIKINTLMTETGKISKEAESTIIKPYLLRYEKFLQQNKSGYFVGNQITWADFWIYQDINSCCGHMVKEYKNLEQFVKKIDELPSIKKWLKSRPNTQR